MKILQTGLSGGDVKKWQSFLFGKGYDVEADGVFGISTATATINFQIAQKLPADGKVGNQTYAAAARLGFPLVVQNSAYPPKPDFPYPSDDQRHKMLGWFRYEKLPGGNIKILDGWQQKNLVKVRIPQLLGIENAPKNGEIYFHKNGVEQLKALFAAWEEAGLLDYIKTWAGTFNPRLIRGSNSVLSNHAYGAAFDINAAWNGLGIAPPLADQEGSVVPLVAIANAHGFYWGGHYNNRKDGMHFELAVLNRFPKTKPSASEPSFAQTIAAVVEADKVKLQQQTSSAAAPALIPPTGSPSKPSDAQGFDSPATADYSNANPAQDEPPPINTTAQTVSEQTTVGNTTVEKTTSEITNNFSPANLPAFIPRFGKQWLLGLIPTGFSFATIIAAVENAPVWLVFALGFITGCATLGFLQLLVKHREIVGQFIINCYNATANPQMHNLIPTQAKEYIGFRRTELLSALAKPETDTSQIRVL